MTVHTAQEAARWFAQLGLTEPLPARGRVVLVSCPLGDLFRVKPVRGGYSIEVITVEEVGK